jgi:hypothetical protein
VLASSQVCQRHRDEGRKTYDYPDPGCAFEHVLRLDESDPEWFIGVPCMVALPGKLELQRSYRILNVDGSALDDLGSQAAAMKECSL